LENSLSGVKLSWNFFHFPEESVMKNRLILLVFLLVSVLIPGVFYALEPKAREEVALEWVKLHNGKLKPEVQGYAKKIKVGHNLWTASFHKKVVPMKRLKTGSAPDYGIPVDKSNRNNTVTPLTGLYRSQFKKQVFLIADYSNEYDSALSNTDIYMKVGLHYHFLFHGQGYPGSARLMTLGKDSPLFFEIDTFGGGSRCDRIIYLLNQMAVDQIDKDLFDHADQIDVQKYVLEVLRFDVRHEGFTLYKDVDHDGAIEIVNSTRVDCPRELAEQIKNVYKESDLDLGGFTRKTVTFYKWNANKFDNLGDFIY
jgi:hypothetical protein